MKSNVSPALVVVAIVCVVAVVGFFLYRASTEKPSYPGANAGHPAALVPGGGTVEHKEPMQVRSSTEAARQGFSGAAPGSQVPAAMQGQGQ